MCFSAGASFMAGSILSGAGILAIRRTEKPTQRFFASIPLIFGIQQLAEGVLWLSLQEVLPVAFEASSKYFFLFFAQVFWPSWVPLCFYMLEKGQPQARILRWFLAAGVFVSAVLAWFLIADGATAAIQAYHIDYQLGGPHGWPGNIVTLLYLIVTIVPPFLSGKKGMRTLGIALALSALITYLMYYTWFVSVWCFFAALISFWVLYLVGKLQESKESKQAYFTSGSAHSHLND